MPAQFRFLARCPETQARVGLLHTTRGPIETPVFMPVGTQAAIKALSPDEVAAVGASCILSNTYHVALRPGADLIEGLGGLHAFMGWNRPILTDSGGFQVMSLGELRQVTDQGVVFRSHLDRTTHYFSPERVIQLQGQLGSDIAMVLDVCTAYPCSRQEAAEAMRRTHAWAARSQAAQSRPDQSLFAIVQGGSYADLRRESATTLARLDFPGYGIGGLSVGEPRTLTRTMLEATIACLPTERPRYLMGVGAPEDLIEYVGYGVDMFDCVLPTRLGRNAAVFTLTGRLDLRQSRYATAERPIDSECRCYTCTHHSLAYLHYLFRVREPLAYRLASLHNVAFLIALTERIRYAIWDGSYPSLRDQLLARLSNPLAPVS